MKWIRNADHQAFEVEKTRLNNHIDLLQAENAKLKIDLEAAKDTAWNTDVKNHQLEIEVADLKSTKLSKRASQIEDLLFARNEENYNLDARLGRIGTLVGKLCEELGGVSHGPIASTLSKLVYECSYYAPKATLESIADDDDEDDDDE